MSSKVSQNHLDAQVQELQHLVTQTSSLRVQALLRSVSDELTQEIKRKNKAQEKSKQKQSKSVEDVDIEEVLANPSVQQVCELLPYIELTRVWRALQFVCFSIEQAIDLLLNGTDLELYESSQQQSASQPQVIDLTMDETYDGSSASSAASSSSAAAAAALPEPDAASVKQYLLSNTNINNVFELEKEFLRQAQHLDQLEQRRAKLAKEIEALERERKASSSSSGSPKKDKSVEEYLAEEKIQRERMLLQKKLREESLSRQTQFFCQGEQEVLRGTKPKRFNLYPTFDWTMSGEEIHFHIVASQFYRWGRGVSAQQAGATGATSVTQVEYCVNPEFIKKFNKAKETLAARHDMLVSSFRPVLLFHGTSDANQENIIQTGFLLSKVGSSTDMGFYGKGIYFSEYPSLSISYSRGGKSFLLNQVLTGKTFRMSNVQTGCELQKGYDCHISPCGTEVVIFNMDCIVPQYKVHFA